MRGTKLSNLGIVIVDMQDKYVNLVDMYKVKPLIGAHVNLITEAILKDIPVILVETKGDGRTNKKLKELVSYVPQHQTIKKLKNSAFEGTDLQYILNDYDVQNPLVTGISSLYCVRATALDGKKLRYNVLTSEDLMAIQFYHEKFNKPLMNWYAKNFDHYKSHIKILNKLQ